MIKNNVSGLLLANGSIKRFTEYVKQNHIEIIHWHSLSTARGETKKKVLEILAFCRDNNIKVIETSPFCVYDPLIDNLLTTKLFVSQINLLKYFYKYSSRLANKNKYGYLYNPLDTKDLSEYVLDQKNIDELKRIMGIGEKDFVIGRIGRADIWKWDDAIIDIVPLLAKKMDNFKVVIRAIPRPKINRIDKKYLDKFIFLPESVSELDICETYQVLDVLLHTSRIGECNSVAINEALFFGKPVISNSTDFRSFTLFDRDNGQVEIVTPGENGFIENTKMGILNKLLLLYRDKDLYQKISDNNKKKAMALFEAGKITRQLEERIMGNIPAAVISPINMADYDAVTPKEGFFELLSINTKAVYEKLIYKLLRVR